MITRVYTVMDTEEGIVVEVFQHYGDASTCLDEAEENGASPDRYRIDGPFEITVAVT